MKKLLPLLFGLKLRIQYLFSKEKAITTAFDLFCTPRKGKTKPYEAEFLNTANQKNLQLAGHDIKMYEWQGTAGTILLLHGWDSNSFRWKPMIELLHKNNYHIIAIDAPAHGQSNGEILNVPLYTECLNDFLKSYKVDAIIAHSIGAMTAIYFEKKYQQLINTPIIALGPPSELYLFFKGFKDTLGLSKRFMKGLEEYLFQKFGFYPKEFSIARFAKKIKVPGLLILEKKDPLAPYQLSKRIADKWQNGELIAVEGVGHSLKHPDIDNRILEYLNAELS